MMMKDETSLLHSIAYIVLFIGALVCLLPFVLIGSASLTSSTSIVRDGFQLWPKQFSLEGYIAVFQFPEQMLNAYKVTIFTTAAGTGIGMFLITMTAYVLQRKDFKYRNPIAFFIYFTTLFGGGLVPWYILITKYLKLTDTYNALIFPGLMTPFLIILMKSFMRSSIPHELVEAAKVDGANDFKIYYKIVLPLSLPGIATVGLFLALNYWNDWLSSSLFITDPDKYQLQFYLYNIINTMEFITRMSIGSSSVQVPAESTKMAMAILVTGPILFLYPLVQRFFIKGLTMGAIKG